MSNNNESDEKFNVDSEKIKEEFDQLKKKKKDPYLEALTEAPEIYQNEKGTVKILMEG